MEGSNGKTMIYTNGSKAEGTLGMVAGAGCAAEGNGQEIVVGTRAIVKDGEIEGIQQAIQDGTQSPIIIFSDPQAAIKRVVRAEKGEKARTTAMKKIIEGILE